MQEARDDHSTSFGVFKPVGHVVISFPTASQADDAERALRDRLQPPAASIRPYTDREMLAQIEVDIANASPIAAIGQELNLVKAHRALALRGYHWLIVSAANDGQARHIAEIVRPFGAERAQQYGNFIIVELIEHADDEAQVAESPDRGLDAQTPSGSEGERADLRPGGEPGRVPPEPR